MKTNDLQRQIGILKGKHMDFISEYNKLKTQGFHVTEEAIEFVEALEHSDEIETHFQIYCMEMRRPREERGFGIFEGFASHGRAGGDYLLNRLNDEDEVASHAAYLLSTWHVQSGCRISAEENAIILQKLTRLSESEDCQIRRRCLIAVGWIGTEKELALLNRHLLTDPDALCRAWSASSYLQLAEGKRIAREVLQETARDSMIKCLKSEKDIFVRGVAAETIQSVWMTSFGLRASAVEARNEKAIEKGVVKALAYLEQHK